CSGHPPPRPPTVGRSRDGTGGGHVHRWRRRTILTAVASHRAARLHLCPVLTRTDGKNVALHEAGDPGRTVPSARRAHAGDVRPRGRPPDGWRAVGGPPFVR